MRQLSVLARAAAFSSETKEVFLILLTLQRSEPPYESVLRVVNNHEDIISGGYTYIAFPFEIILPAQREDQVPIGQIKIDNVDRRIVQAVRSIDVAMNATIQIVLASQPDVIEWMFEGFQLKSVSYDALFVEGELRLEEILIEPFPKDIYSPGLFPGLFATY